MCACACVCMCVGVFVCVFACGVIGEISSTTERQLQCKVCVNSQKTNYVSAERSENQLVSLSLCL